MITHPKSIGFSILEEGLNSYHQPTAYAPSEPLWRRQAIKLALKKAIIATLFGRRAKGKGEFSETNAFVGKGARQYYCFSDQAFQYTPRLCVLDLRNACRSCEGILRAPTLPSGTVVLALKNVAFMTKGEFSVYKSWIVNNLEKLRCDRNLAHIAYKHHPQPTPRREELEVFLESFAMLRSDVVIEQLSADVSLELLAAKSPNLTFLVGTSSVGLYARQLGANVITN